MTISPLSVFFLMLLGHLVADFTLQGWLANGKQKSWWDEQLKGAPDSTKSKYRNDYKVALVCHSLYWSIIVCLPLILHPIVFALLVVANAVVHYVVDDGKANLHVLNLVQDQFAHLLQIIWIWSVYVVKLYT